MTFDSYKKPILYRVLSLQNQLPSVDFSTIKRFNILNLHFISGGEDSSPVNAIPDATIFSRKPDK